MIKISVSLRSIIHSYYSRKFIQSSKFIEFSVSLRSIIHSYGCNLWRYRRRYTRIFPSPYGVSFILIRTEDGVYLYCRTINNFRLLTEYHSFLLVNGTHKVKYTSPISVSLRSIIHSYYIQEKSIIPVIVETFPSPYGVSFILIWFEISFYHLLFPWGFPSPYGVSFILILYIPFNSFTCSDVKYFRLLTEYHSFLLLKEFLSMDIYQVWFPSPYGVSFILML